MTTDRELLELAAKAAGFHDAVWAAEQACVQTLMLPGFRCFWNPLTDDGDAMRLAVKLLFEIDMGRDGIAIRHSTGIKILGDFSKDPYAATRRAIVHAAAEIGRSRHD